MSDAHHFTWEITQTYNLFTWQVEELLSWSMNKFYVQIDKIMCNN